MSQNQFTLMGVDTEFDIDITQLNLNFRKLQQSVHPDKFAANSHAEKLAAVNKMAQINDAYQTLRNPILRSETLLQLQGWVKPSDDVTVKDTSLLMEQMALREQLEDLGQSQQTLADIEKFESHINQLIQQQIAEISIQFHQSASAKEIYSMVNRLKFLTKLKKEVSTKVEQLEELDD